MFGAKPAEGGSLFGGTQNMFGNPSTNIFAAKDKDGNKEDEDSDAGFVNEEEEAPTIVLGNAVAQKSPFVRVLD